MNMFWICKLGPTPYEETFELQLRLRQARLQNKIPNLLLLTSHPPVFTLGKRNCSEDFQSSREQIGLDAIEIIRTNRGGRVTYHGPGQIIGYFIVDIRSIKLSIPGFVAKIEELLISTLSHFQLQTHRDPQYPGVWMKDRKIAAMGLHFDRGVSIHGFALNVNPDLKHYRHIIPCGILNRSVTSMESELGDKIKEESVEKILEEKVKEIFKKNSQRVEFPFLKSFIEGSPFSSPAGRK